MIDIQPGTTITISKNIPDGYYIIQRSQDARPGDRARREIDFYRTPDGLIPADAGVDFPDSITENGVESGYLYGTVTSGQSWGSIGVLWDGAGRESTVDPHRVDVLRPIPGRERPAAARERS